MDDKAKSRILILLVAVTFLIMYVVVNAQELIWGALIYLIMFFFCIFMYSQWSKFGKVSDLEGLDNHWVINSLLGIGIGVGILILGQFISFIGVIGIPNTISIAGVIGRFIIICIVAPVFETVFFFDFFEDLLEKIGLPKYISVPLTAVSFALFHLVAYGGSLASAGGSFFSAFLMGNVFGVITEWRNSLAPAITMHMVLNIFIAFVKLSVILLGAVLILG